MIYALHGAVGHADDWKFLSSGLVSNGAGERVSRVDLWRYLMCCPQSLREFASAFNKEVLAQQSRQKNAEDKPVLLGYSMGGRLALHVLLDSPDIWGGVIIVSAHTGIPESERPARLAMDAEWAAKALKGDWPEFLNQWNAQGVLDTDVMPNRLNLEQRRQPVARSFMDWSLGNQEDLLPMLKSAETCCPILWVVGENDQKFTKVAREVAREMPSVQLEIVADAGHRVPWEQPEEFTKILGDWLRNS